MKYKFLLVVVDKRTYFMQDAGMFNKNKAIAESNVISFESDNENIETVFNTLKKGCELQSKKLIALICLNNQEYQYINTDIKYISNGKRFCFIEEYLNKQGVEIK